MARFVPSRRRHVGPPVDRRGDEPTRAPSTPRTGIPMVATLDATGAVAAVTRPWSGAGGRSRLSRLQARVADYLALTKPGILTLLLTTTLGAMLIAAEGVPSLWLILATLVGGALSAGGANVLNCYLDRDIDAQMPRTSPAHRGRTHQSD